MSSEWFPTQPVTLSCEVSYDIHNKWVCAESVHADPTGAPTVYVMWSFFIFRAYLQPSISHPSGVSHRDDKAFHVYSNVFSEKTEPSKICLSFQKGEVMMIKWNIFLYNCNLSLSSLYLSQTLFLSRFLHLSRSPPRPSPGSLHYSDEDVSTKYNDLIPAESSSLTEKPSEISDSQVSRRWPWLSARVHPASGIGNELELESKISAVSISQSDKVLQGRVSEKNTSLIPLFFFVTLTVYLLDNLQSVLSQSLRFCMAV